MKKTLSNRTNLWHCYLFGIFYLTGLTRLTGYRKSKIYGILNPENPVNPVYFIDNLILSRHLLLLLATWFLFTSHEFWLAPAKYRLAAGQTGQVDLLVGEDFHGEYWGSRGERTLSLHHHFGKKKKNLTKQAVATDSASINFSTRKAGTHLLAMRSKNSFIELEGPAFNGYLEEDGIENILALRKERGEMDKPAREFYQRCAKALVQVGDETDETYKTNCGMPLEIIPLANPYKLNVGDKLPVQILFEGKPWTDAVVRTWHKMDETKTNKADHRTNGEGIAEIELNAKGYWMISLVRMVENIDKSQADYQSFWGSLTFEM